jgi:LuxR family maltose regulon positive regulatory protein
MSDEKTVESANSELTYPLSDRELEVLRMLPKGRTAKMMGVAMSISHRTVNFHLDNLYWKLGVSGLDAKNRAIKKGRALGLID